MNELDPAIIIKQAVSEILAKKGDPDESPVLVKLNF
jgi:hypothetical protein